jgi:hypothetical protein
MLTTTQAPARTVVTLMFFASGVALVETEVSGKGKTSGVRIIMGFTIGTVFLTLLASAPVASKFAVGLAAITLASSTLIYGSQLATGINKLTGTIPAASSTGITQAPGTTPITPAKAA